MQLARTGKKATATAATADKAIVIAHELLLLILLARARQLSLSNDDGDGEILLSQKTRVPKEKRMERGECNREHRNTGREGRGEKQS